MAYHPSLAFCLRHLPSNPSSSIFHGLYYYIHCCQKQLNHLTEFSRLPLLAACCATHKIRWTLMRAELHWWRSPKIVICKCHRRRQSSRCYVVNDRHSPLADIISTWVASWITWQLHDDDRTRSRGIEMTYGRVYYAKVAASRCSWSTNTPFCCRHGDWRVFECDVMGWQHDATHETCGWLGRMLIKPMT